jgi:hypothetical protein
MAGSPKDSTRPISKRPRSCWRSVTVSEDTGLRYADGAVDFGNRSDE